MMIFISIDAMRKINSLLALSMFAISVGCTKDILDTAFPVQNRDEFPVSEITAILGDEMPGTKITFYEGTDAGNHTVFLSKWSESDAIVFTPDFGDASKAVVFNLVGGQGTGNGIFRGEEELTAESRNWTVYYPASVKSDADFDSFSFSSQTQTGNDNTSHLSALNLMRKRYTYQDAVKKPSSISFSGEDFDQSSCIKFVLSGFPETITPTSLTMEVYSYATWMWSSINQEINTQTSFSQTLSFTGIGATDSVIAYMMVPAKNQTFSQGHFLRITLNGAGGKKFITERRLPNDIVLNKGTYNTMSFKKNWLPDTGIDGTWGAFQTPTADVTNKYCNIIFMGDGYTCEDYQGGDDCKFIRDARTAYEAIFSVEPYKSLKEYFGVYYVNVVSGQKIYTTGDYPNGAQNVDTHTPFEVMFTPNATETSGFEQRVLFYAEKITDLSVSQVCRSAMCVIANTHCHAGSCTLYYGNKETDYCEPYSVAYLPLGKEGVDEAESFRLCVLHEVGGHGFGKLADEYTLPEYYPDPTYVWSDLAMKHSKGIYLNVDKYEDGITTVSDTPWASLAGIDTYSPEQLGIYEGAYLVSRDFCRPTPNSIMRDSSPSSNSDYFNAISRKQIYHRVMRLSGKSRQEAEDGFLAWDAAHLPATGPYVQTKSMLLMTSQPGNSLLPLAKPTTICLEN